MDNSAKNKVSENFASSPFQSTSKKRHEEKNSKEVKDATDIGRNAYVEAVGLDESVETTGKVSEVLQKSAENEGAGGAMAGGKTARMVDPEKIRQNLLNNLPSESQMKKQVETEIKKEIDYLHKKAMKMLRSPGQMSYFEMANLMKKIRELKGILLQLLKASLDMLKTLWLRFVHGIM